jgi:hypothetical protein
MHEFAHFTTALLLGKPKGFSIWPKTSGNKMVFGNVSASVRFMVLHAFIAAAPLVWWVALYFLLKFVGLITFLHALPDMGFDQFTKKAGNLSLKHIIVVWLIFQLLWAGCLSTQDIKNFFKGIFSASGLAFIVAGTAVVILML